ncbi:MAG: lipopolysaccharide heptosyltransferase II [Nitrospirae bacterium]|nr:lipopolysaccharide heptosyltransferase II [Nitrospirota bacterium]MBI3593571.1 lipopolysaccharide heptosyltransferase II [Nitrospirota bacterium]
MKAIKSDEINKLIVRVPNWIGDAVLAIPALCSIRAHFKTAEIVFLGPESINQLLKGNGLADSFIPVPDKKEGFLGQWRLIQKLKKEVFDLAILFQNAFEAAWIVYLASVPYRFGYDREGRGLLLTHPVRIPAKHLHQMTYYLHLVSEFENICLSRRPPFLNTNEEEKNAAWKILRGEGMNPGDFMIGIHAGAAYGSAKRWETERFAELADCLIREGNVKVIFFGSSEECKVNDEIVSMMSETPVNLSGKTTLRELVALISQCSIFISNDSGPMHIASALNVPLISIFGPTDPKVTSPAGVQNTIIQKETECSPCLLRECPIDHRCMTSIPVSEVMELFHRERALLQKPLIPALFLDRDGTINEDRNYISSEKDFRLYNEAEEALLLLNQCDIPIFIVTNQSGIARGFFTEEFLLKLHQKLEEMLGRSHVKISGLYYCPHHPDEGCLCRKPGTGLIRQILRHNRIDLRKSYFVGDQTSDIELAARIGAKAVLVLTGKGNESLKIFKNSAGAPPVAHVAQNLLEAAQWIRADIRHEEMDTISERTF